MVDPVPSALPDVTPPAVAPDAGKPKGPKDEEKFAHQLKELVVKEQQELTDSDKVKEEKKKENEKRKEKRKKNEKLKQNVSKTQQDNTSKEKGGNDVTQKGSHIDVEA